MSLIRDLDQKLDRVITSAILHAQFSYKLNEDIDAIESKLTVAEAALLASMETRLAAFEAKIFDGLTAVSHGTADDLDRQVGGLARAAPDATLTARRIDPNTGLPASD